MCVSKSRTYLLHLAHFFTGLLLIEVSLLSNDNLIKAELCKTAMLHEKPMGTETISTWFKFSNCYLLCGLVYWICMCLHIFSTLTPSNFLPHGLTDRKSIHLFIWFEVVWSSENPKEIEGGRAARSKDWSPWSPLCWWLMPDPGQTVPVPLQESAHNHLPCPAPFTLQVVRILPL